MIRMFRHFHEILFKQENAPFFITTLKTELFNEVREHSLLAYVLFGFKPATLIVSQDRLLKYKLKTFQYDNIKVLILPTSSGWTETRDYILVYNQQRVNDLFRNAKIKFELEKIQILSPEALISRWEAIASEFYSTHPTLLRNSSIFFVFHLLTGILMGYPIRHVLDYSLGKGSTDFFSFGGWTFVMFNPSKKEIETLIRDISLAQIQILSKLGI